MLLIRLVRRPGGSPAHQPVVRELQAGGTTIGRGEDCDLVLEDPLRLVSRRHALLTLQGSQEALLRCVSTSASLSVNGESVPPGGERTVVDGDRIGIGAFEMLLEAPTLAPENRATAAGTTQPGLADAAPAPQQDLRSPQRDQPAAEQASVPPAAAPSAAPQEQTPPEQPQPRAPSRLDAWFDLDHVADPLGPGSPLTPIVRDAAPEPDGPPPPEAHPAASARLDAVALKRDRPARTRRAGAERMAQDAASAKAEERPSARGSSRRQPGLDQTGDAATALRQAFLQGAGLDARTRLGPDPDWATHAGALLRRLSEGTFDLLRSRAVTKQSIRAEGTRIAQRDNNPLKFAPDAIECLRLLLDQTGRPGFLDPISALRDAHDDLQHHQVAMLAGMRAAVFELIARLGPAATEEAEGPATGMARWFALWRDADLWRRHHHEHAALMASLDDTFEAVFGREFLRAYEAQAKRAAQPPGQAAPDPRVPPAGDNPLEP